MLTICGTDRFSYMYAINPHPYGFAIVATVQAATAARACQVAARGSDDGRIASAAANTAIRSTPKTHSTCRLLQTAMRGTAQYSGVAVRRAAARSIDRPHAASP